MSISNQLGLPYANSAQMVHQWTGIVPIEPSKLVRNVLLVREENALFYIVQRTSEQAHRWLSTPEEPFNGRLKCFENPQDEEYPIKGKISIPDEVSLEQMQKYLQERCEPVFEGENILFSPVLLEWEVNSHCRIRCLRGTKLTWQLYYPEKKIRTILPFFATIASDNCSPEVEQKLQGLYAKPIAEAVNTLKSCIFSSVDRWVLMDNIIEKISPPLPMSTTTKVCSAVAAVSVAVPVVISGVTSLPIIASGSLICWTVPALKGIFAGLGAWAAVSKMLSLQSPATPNEENPIAKWRREWAYVSLVKIEPRSVPSGFDRTVPVTLFRSAVTLITFGGSQGNHALGVVEVFNDGSYSKYGKVTQSVGELVRFLFHFTGSEIKMKVQSDIQYQTRSIVWLKDVESVKRMLDAVLQQKGPKAGFYKWGADAIKSKGNDNCFTWLRAQFRIAGIDLGKSYIGWAATMAKNWTKPAAYYRSHPQNEKV